jgi:hypothetical protein
MDFLNDKKNSAILILVSILLIGGAIGSCVHFMGASSAQPLVISSDAPPQNGSGRPGASNAASQSGQGMPGPSNAANRPGSGMPGPGQ